MSLRQRLTRHNRKRSKRPDAVRTALLLGALGLLVYLIFIAQAMFGQFG